MSPQEVSLILVLVRIHRWEEAARTDGRLPQPRAASPLPSASPTPQCLGSVFKLARGERFEGQTLTWM